MDWSAQRARLRLLSGFRLEHHGTAVTLSAAGQRLLALLSVRGAMARTAVAGTLWPEATERHAHGSLRTTLWRLGHAGFPLVESRTDRLALANTVDVDVRSFVAWARRVLARATSDDDLDTAAVHGGDLLPGWYEDWVLFERERLRQLQLHALEDAALQLCESRRYGTAIDVALRAVRLEPLRESANRTLITIHLHENNGFEAIRQFRTFRRLLNAELGVEPSPQLRALISDWLPHVGPEPVRVPQR